MGYNVRSKGAKYSVDYRVFLTDDKGDTVSPFHGVPLRGHEHGTVRMVCEMPRHSNAKFEISGNEYLNPIRQKYDHSKGQLRFVENYFPIHGLLWNYGSLPQTWESGIDMDPHLGCKGDNDPLDVCEIGGRIMQIGEVRWVKILGALGLVSHEEADWKVFAIDVQDSLAPQINSIEDVGLYCPQLLETSAWWLSCFPSNSFPFGKQYFGREFALQLIDMAHQRWTRLVKEEIQPISAVDIPPGANEWTIPKTSLHFC